MNDVPVIDNLMKVSLDIWPASSGEDMDQNRVPEKMSFIYGAGARGLNDFEYLIAGKKVGDEITVKVAPSDFHRMFSHLACEFRNVAGDHSGDVWLVVKVTGISLAENREVVKAIADSGACGGDCDCGCGC